VLPGYDLDTFRERLKGVFTPAQPIAKSEHLHGRDQKLRLIDRALHSPGKHLFVFGDRGVGKTSLARTAASIHAGDEDGFAFVACDQNTTFFDIVQATYRKLHTLYSLGKWKVSEGQFSIGVAKFKTVEALGLPELKTINDAVEMLKSIAPKDGRPALVVIDEFDQLKTDTEKKYVADLIKQLSDQKINIRLLICGIGASLEELIGVHLSTDRYLATVPLTPLPHDARWQILQAGSDTFGVNLDRDSIIRIGQLSDGFPYYCHLMGEQIFWQAFDDPNPVTQISMAHYREGLSCAIEEAQTSLRYAYDKATKKHKNSTDYEETLWSVADGVILQRATTDIFEQSYLRIMDERGRTPLPKEQFYQRLNALKKPGHGQILTANRQGWYGFRENIVRGYVRLRAERAGLKIGVDHIRNGNK
jgi:hypothetical protein